MTNDRQKNRPTTGLGDELDQGKGRDKNPYPDPAAAPLGTDDEAAGNPITPEQMEMAREHEIRQDPPMPSDAPAVLHGRETHEFDTDATLQPPPTAKQAQPDPSRWLAYAIAALVVLLVLWFIFGR